MTTAAALRAEAQRLTRAQPTDELVAAFTATDGMLDDLTGPRDAGTPMSAVDAAAYLTVTTARGFMLDELETRGELERVMGTEARS